jgi:ElaB/YqjD/DUF883 family membrane-anchored ribosome-binding protein
MAAFRPHSVRGSLRDLRPCATTRRCGFRRKVVVVQNDRNEKASLNTSRKFQQLITDVEELLARLDDEHGPQFDKLRDRIEETMSQAKATLTKQSNSTADQVRQYAGMADDYITEYPRTAFASGILLGAVLGFLLATARSRD